MREVEDHKDMCTYFIDYKEAFDKVKHSKMIECLSKTGVDDKDLQTITNLYREQTAGVRTGN